MCVCIVVFEYACMYVHSHLCESQRKMLDVLLSFSFSLRQSLSMNLKPGLQPVIPGDSPVCLLQGYKYEHGDA